GGAARRQARRTRRGPVRDRHAGARGSALSPRRGGNRSALRASRSLGAQPAALRAGEPGRTSRASADGAAIRVPPCCAVKGGLQKLQKLPKKHYDGLHGRERKTTLFYLSGLRTRGTHHTHVGMG